MSEKRFTFEYDDGEWGVPLFYDDGKKLCFDDVVVLLNEQQATIEHLKKRLYDFEKRKIIEESEIDEDVIPKVKVLRTELFGEKYE